MDKLAYLLYYFHMPNKTISTNAANVPQFALYGESALNDVAELVHVELIETRSRQHDWHIARHTHRGLFQLLFLLRGRVRAEIDGEVWDCEGPTVITIHPSVVHGFDFSKAARGYVLTLDQSVLFGNGGADQVDRVAQLFVEPMQMSFSTEAEALDRIVILLEHMMQEFATPMNGHARMLDWLGRCVLLLLLRQQKDRQDSALIGRADFDNFSRFRELVDAHFREQWNVSKYAAKLKMTESRLNRLCLRLGGKSAFDLAQQRLILEARRKLTYVPASVSGVAYELGFQDPAYFSRVFKRHTGLTPIQFRQQAVDPA
jgi:AraC family transcriptional activator of pobA